jgi:hypothetical protein
MLWMMDTNTPSRCATRRWPTPTVDCCSSLGRTESGLPALPAPRAEPRIQLWFDRFRAIRGAGRKRLLVNSLLQRCPKRSRNALGSASVRFIRAAFAAVGILKLRAVLSACRPIDAIA